MSHYLPHSCFSHTGPFAQIPTSGPLLKLFYLRDTHLLPTTVFTLYNDEFSSFKGKFHLFHNALHVPLLGKPPSTFTLLLGALHIMLRSGSHVLLCLPYAQKLPWRWPLRLTQHCPEGLAPSSLQ